MNAKELLIISDPGHAWLRVPLAKGLPFGTGYGYVDRRFAYLEEDCEMTAFLKAHPELDLHAIPEVFYENCFVRNLSLIPENYDWRKDYA